MGSTAKLFKSMLCFRRISEEAASLNEPYDLLLKWFLRPRLWITFALF